MSDSAAVDPLFLELQGALAGRYSLERELGRGGMGIVYLARDVQLDRLVAIKLFPPHHAARPELRQRFLREARTAARLSHPNIVPIHAVEEAGQLVYFVMAYVPGESLAARLQQRRVLTPGELAPILRDVAWALVHAHNQSVVHRDVKPDNILLESGGRRALVADFGIAVPARLEPGQQDGVMGTVAYMSPEQARGDAVDGRSDLYSLGVVAYLSLSGTLPYPTTSLDQLVQLQLAGPPPSLTVAAPHVPRALCRTVDRCLAGYASARFQTGDELAEILNHLGSGTDLPAPVRVWLTRNTQIRGGLSALTVIWALPAIPTILFTLFNRGALPVGVAASILAIIGVPWLVYFAGRIIETRKLFAAGYRQSDLLTSLEAHIQRRREELAYEFGSGPTRIGRLVRLCLIAGVSGLIIATGAMALGPPGWSWLREALNNLALGSGILGAASYVVGKAIPGGLKPGRDLWAEYSLRFWRSGLGQLVGRLAGWGLRHVGTPDQALHRPTEIALGEAAEALFRALPSQQRRDLKALPEQVRFLSAQAQDMRAKLEELDDLIAQAAPTTLFGERPAGDGGAAELTEARELWATRLRDTVTLLESLRVGLLKLHAGTALPETLTAELDAARDLRERLALLLDGHAEAQRALQPEPSNPSPT